MARTPNDSLAKLLRSRRALTNVSSAVAVLLMLAGCSASEAQRDSSGAGVPASPTAGQTFQDCADCPRMIVVPAGSFTMGSTRQEQDFSVSQGRDRRYTDRENPLHGVTIARPFAVGVFEVTRDQFAVFVRDAGHVIEPGCQTYELNGAVFKRTPRDDKSWLDPGYPQAGNHPVTCLRWEDARAYTQWLARKTGQPYRLLSEAEWEYVARAGTTTYRYWGDDTNDSAACRYANVADQTPHPSGKPWQSDHMYQCSDGYWASSPIGSFEPNAFGVHDIIGNLWEWLEDCANETYQGAPADGSAWLTGNCSRRPLRGGAFHENGAYTRIAMRGFNTSSSRFNTDGFRVARDLQAPAGTSRNQ